MADYLTNVNPAGTVPVLVHRGHPVYESHEQVMMMMIMGMQLMMMMSLEQIRYIDRVLMPEGRKLTPEDPDKKALVEKYVELGAMNMAEVMGVADPWQAWLYVLSILYSIHFFIFG